MSQRIPRLQGYVPKHKKFKYSPLYNFKKNVKKELTALDKDDTIKTLPYDPLSQKDIDAYYESRYGNAETYVNNKVKECLC